MATATATRSSTFTASPVQMVVSQVNEVSWSKLSEMIKVSGTKRPKRPKRPKRDGALSGGLKVVSQVDAVSESFKDLKLWNFGAA